MSFNSLLSFDDEVIRMPCEYLLLKQRECLLSFTLASGEQYSGEGAIVLTSFRLVLINIHQATIPQWKSADLPLPLIYGEMFEPKSKKFSGKIQLSSAEPQAIKAFLVHIESESLSLFEQVYRSIQSKIEEQQVRGQLDLQFQSSLATCVYQLLEIVPKIKDTKSTTYNVQPPPYSGSHKLIEMMEQVLPGIITLESGTSPNRKINPPDGVPPNIIFLQPQISLPASLSEYPSLVNSSNFPNMQIYPRDSIVHAKPVLRSPEPIIPCGKCGSSGRSSEILLLLCGHSAHSHCLARDIKQALKDDKRLEDVKCTQCEMPIEYSILHSASPKDIEELSLKTANII